PFEFESGYPYEQDVRNAMSQWEDAGGVWFCQHGNEPNYVVIRNTTGSSNSPIGMQGGAQSCYIGNGYKALHELGHNTESRIIRRARADGVQGRRTRHGPAALRSALSGKSGPGENQEGPPPSDGHGHVLRDRDGRPS